MGGDLIADIYDDAVAEAEQLRLRADAEYERAIKYPLKELEDAKDRYWNLVAPAEEKHDAAYREAERIEAMGHQNMLAAHHEHQREFSGFVNDLLTAAAEGGEDAMKQVALAKIAADGIPEGTDERVVAAIQTERRKPQSYIHPTDPNLDGWE